MEPNFQNKSFTSLSRTSGGKFPTYTLLSKVLVKVIMSNLINVLQYVTATYELVYFYNALHLKIYTN